MFLNMWRKVQSEKKPELQLMESIELGVLESVGVPVPNVRCVEL